jgi:chromosome segregation protein
VHLKSLTMRGFKSFASATTLRLEPGITCVVGPNGSGKSNVVDALAWVMGEQGVKSLRGGKMEDVIFAGTAGRPPLGRAEVSLTIDNSDGALPIDYTEVTISRTMFRAGGSEYAINGTGCRLLDIQELLSDSGIGREMHVIVGQGQLDAVLHASPEGRRAFIEEAAGVLKHRKRKEKALRKLDAMQANLTRLGDLTAEVRRQLKPLGRQAKVARRAQVIQADLRDAKARLLADDLVQATSTLAAEVADEAALRARRDQVDAELARTREHLARAEQAAAMAAPRLAAAQQVWFQLSGLRERLRGTVSLAADRARLLAEAQAESVRPVGRDPEELEAQAYAVREQELALEAEVEMARAVLDTAVEERQLAEEAGSQEERRLEALVRAAADRREGLARLAGKVAARRSRAEAVQEETERLTAALAEAEQRTEVAQREYSALEEQVTGTETGQEDLEAGYQASRAELDQAEAEVDRLALDEREAESERATWTARREALELGLRRKDGAGSLLAAGERISGVLGSMAALLEVDTGHGNAVAAALGIAADAVVVTTPEAAAQAVRLLKQDDAGRATLVVASGFTPIAGAGADPIELPDGPTSTGDVVLPGVTGAAAGDDRTGGGPLVDLRASGLPPAAAVATLTSAAAPSRSAPVRATTDRLSGGPAAVSLPAGARWARDLVRAPRVLAEALDALLAGVVVVTDTDAAADLLSGHPQLTAVTFAGDVVSGRLVQGGSPSAPSLIEVQAAVDEATEHAAAATRRAEQAGFALKTARARKEAAAEEVQAALHRTQEADARRAAVAGQLGQLSGALRAARSEAERHRRSLAGKQESLVQDQQVLAELEARLAAAREAPEEDEPSTEERDRLAAQALAARSAETEARLSLRTAEERTRALAGRAEQLERAAATEREERTRAAAREERRRRQVATAQAVLAGARYTLDLLEGALAEADGLRLAAEAERARIERDLVTVRDQVHVLGEEQARLVDSVHRDEVARAEQRLRIENLRQRSVDELGIEPDILVEEYGPHQLVPPSPQAPGDPAPRKPPEPAPFVREEQAKRLRTAERALTQLGTVNPLALEEFAALEERHKFLTEQLEDLKRSRRDLMDIIKEVDDRVEKVFTEAFTDTAREFEQVFSRLFPGGEGRLVLTDPENMLTTGLDVEARPPGKKVKRLSLLSGGERSLTSVALLVAIFRARPSPFYVLDEVEAALDDTNLGRLITLYEELRDASQLIVITHQKRTMEIADALYGVTMRGDGVTTVISQRLREDRSA